MIHLTPFMPSDLLGFVVQPEQREEVPDPEEFAIEILQRGGESVSVRDGNRKVLMVGGIAAHDATLGVCWALISADAGPSMLGITRITRQFFDASACRTLIFVVDCRSKAARRWGHLLGFEDRGMVQWQSDPDLHLFVKERG